MLTKTDNLKELYEKDFLLWIEKTIELLSDRQLKDVDYDNLIEELAAMGRTEKRTVKSLVRQILIHLLLYQYWTAKHKYNAKHWKGEIITFRQQLKGDLTSTLYNYLLSELNNLYDDAKETVEHKTKLNIFPSQCPYTLEQIIDKNWLPSISE